MAKTKVTIPQIIVNNKTIITPPSTMYVETMVRDGVIVADEHYTNPGVVYSNQH